MITVFQQFMKRRQRRAVSRTVKNLIRLQKWLRGKAQETVRYLVLLPLMVPDVIKILNSLYGCPEVIVHIMLQKDRSVTSPKAKKLGTLIIYELSMQNLCVTIEASALQANLNNPPLLQKLVE